MTGDLPDVRNSLVRMRTFPMSEADVDAWRKEFQAPDTDEFSGGEIPSSPAEWTSWEQWAADHWPSSTDS
jgi:hypothetical protein